VTPNLHDNSNIVLSAMWFKTYWVQCYCCCY